jgi:hypothetical protein
VEKVEGAGQGETATGQRDVGMETLEGIVFYKGELMEIVTVPLPFLTRICHCLIW